MDKPSILVIDDEVEVGTFLRYYLEDEKGFPVAVANSGKEARELLGNKSFDLALVDLKLPDSNGISLLKEIKDNNPGCEVIIMTGYSTVKSAVEAMKLGAFDYIDKPFDELEELDELLDRALQSIRNKHSYIKGALDRLTSEFGIVMAGNSPMKDLLILCKKVATRKISVLIEGETGTGKELLARFIHANSPRAVHPFIGVNCGALTETLLESELFGHEKGAFTGAQGMRPGIFEVAHRGTLFLDEIGEATPAIQVKLLRVLETGEFFRVGGSRPIKIDVRVLAATNNSLREAVKNKLFREDLLYRLDVVCLQIPPLLQRPMDIMLLANHFIEKNLPEGEKQLKATFSPRAAEILQNYHWPGNVRELSNVVARAMAFREGEMMGPECLPGHLAPGGREDFPGRGPGAPVDIEGEVREYARRLTEAALNRESIDLNAFLRVLKNEADAIIREVIDHMLEKAGFNHTEAAKQLNISHRTLRYLRNEKGK